MKQTLLKLLDHVGRYNRLVDQYKRATHTAPDSALAYVNWGIELAQAGNFEAAIEKFTTATQMAPNRPEGYTNWGVALAKSHRLEEAIEKFQRATELAPGGIMSHVLWGAALLELGRVEEAKAKYDEAIALGPNNPEPYVNRGIAMARMGMYAEAMQSFKTALALRSYQPQVYFLWGAVLAEIEQHENAIEKFKLTLRFVPKHADAYHFWSVSLNRLGRYEEAIEKARVALDLNPDKPEIYLNLGDALANMNRHDVAIANYQHALRLDPTLAEAYLSWGLSILRGEPASASTNQDQLAQACERFAQALSLNPDLPNLHAFWGVALVDAHRYGDALPHLEAAYRADSKSIQVLLNWATALMKLSPGAEGVEAGLEKLRMAELQDRWDPAVNRMLGLALMEKGEFEEAVLYLNKALEVEPEKQGAKHFEEATIALSLALCELGRSADAVRTMRVLWRKQPDSARLNALYAKVLASAGDWQDAEAKYHKALAQNPQQNEARLGLAELYIQRGQGAKALPLVDTLVQSNPEWLPALFLQAVVFLSLAEQNPSQTEWLKVQALFQRMIEIDAEHLHALAALAYLAGRLNSERAMDDAFQTLLTHYPDPHPAHRMFQTYATAAGQRLKGQLQAGAGLPLFIASAK